MSFDKICPVGSPRIMFISEILLFKQWEKPNLSFQTSSIMGSKLARKSDAWYLLGLLPVNCQNHRFFKKAFKWFFDLENVLYKTFAHQRFGAEVKLVFPKEQWHDLHVDFTFTSHHDLERSYLGRKGTGCASYVRLGVSSKQLVVDWVQVAWVQVWPR